MSSISQGQVYGSYDFLIQVYTSRIDSANFLFWKMTNKHGQLIESSGTIIDELLEHPMSGRVLLELLCEWQMNGYRNIRDVHEVPKGEIGLNHSLAQILGGFSRREGSGGLDSSFVYQSMKYLQDWGRNFISRGRDKAYQPVRDTPRYPLQSACLSFDPLKSTLDVCFSHLALRIEIHRLPDGYDPYNKRGHSGNETDSFHNA